MDFPDRIIDDRVRLWRFRAEVHLRLPDCRYTYINPVPIWVDAMKVVGFACLEERKDRFLAECALNYEVPERLDAEAGKEVGAFARVTDVYMTDPTQGHALVAVIRGIYLATKGSAGYDAFYQEGLTPVGQGVL